MTSMLFSLVFANNTFFSCIFFLFLIIELYFLIAAVIAEIFHLTVELVVPIGLPTKETKAEIEIYPVTAEAKIGKCSM